MWRCGSGFGDGNPRFDESEEFVDEVFDGIGADEFADIEGGLLAHFAEAAPVFPGAVHGFVEKFDGGGFDEEAVEVVVEKFADAADVGGDGGASAEHGFDEGEREAFVARREDQGVVSGPNFFNVVYETPKSDIGEVEIFCEATKAAFIYARADQRDADIAFAPVRKSEHLQQQILSFLDDI